MPFQSFLYCPSTFVFSFTLFKFWMPIPIHCGIILSYAFMLHYINEMKYLALIYTLYWYIYMHIFLWLFIWLRLSVKERGVVQSGQLICWLGGGLIKNHAYATLHNALHWIFSHFFIFACLFIFFRFFIFVNEWSALNKWKCVWHIKSDIFNK